ncbi:MAG: alpha/beta fold hydrolase [Casimicrobiaceae bacterium]
MFKLERKGSEPAVVFVHGFCQSSAYWKPTLEMVAERGAHGIAVDLPGFGASAREPGPYTMEGLADALARDLDVWGVAQPIVLVGGSMGGVVAQHFTLRHPERVERLLLVATGGFTPNMQVALEKTNAMSVAAWDEAAVTPIVDGFFNQHPTAEAVAEYRKIALSAAQPAAMEAARSNARNRSFDALGSIRVPTLIIQGRHDRARTPEHGAEMRDRIAGRMLAVIEDAGHTPQLEQPERFHEVALPFLLQGRAVAA